MMMTMMMIRALVGICVLLVAVRGQDDTPTPVLALQRQKQPACPATEFKCHADGSKRFDTFLLVQVEESGGEDPPVISSAAMERAYDFVAGSVCDLCRRRIVEVKQMPKEDQNLLLNKLEQVSLVNSHSLLRGRKLPSTFDDENTHNNLLFQVTIEQVGNCQQAFDTHASTGSDSTVLHFTHVCAAKFFDAASDTCCCSCAADFNAMSRQAFVQALMDLIEDNSSPTLQVLDVLELQRAVVESS